MFIVLYRAKHPIKVHVLAGISKRGPTGIYIFEGIMDASLYTEILQKTLLPFISEVYPTNHRFMADSDPKHSSNEAKMFLSANNVNWWRTPAKSPDCNPMESLWHELKQYNLRVIKPKNKDGLIEGIKRFWRTVTVDKCVKYVDHLKKVLPKVVEFNSAATGY